MSNSGALPANADSAVPLINRDIAPARTSMLRQPRIPWLTDAIVRYRRVLFALCVLLYVVSFNGRWRIGLDSSIYRGLARSLATGRGYHFGEFGSHQIYPGLPLLLAGIDKLAGENYFRPALAQLVILLMGLLTLAVTYRLIASRYPLWMAVAVTCGVALNARFLELSNELLTDAPFLLGVVTSLYGWELLRDARSRRQYTSAIFVLVIGLGLAAVMRPTFWVLGLAWVCACIWGLMWGPRRRFYLGCLLILMIVWAAFARFDPRTRGFAPLGGGYEREAIEIVTDSGIEADSRVAGLVERLRKDLPKLLEIHFPAAFFGIELRGTAGPIFSVLLIGSSLTIVRRHPIWGLLILFTIGVTLMLSTAPRYYVMIVPFVLLSSLVALSSVTQRMPGGWGDLLLAAWMGMVVATNIARMVPFFATQYCAPPWASAETFYAKYRDGRFEAAIHLAKVVRERVPGGVTTVAPSPPIVAFLSDRQVLMSRELLPLRRSARHYPEHLAAQNIRYAVFPARVYKDKDPEMARLIARGVIYPRKFVARVDGMMLARAGVRVPRGDWREGPVVASPTTRNSVHKHSPTTRKSHAPKHHAGASTRPSRKATTDLNSKTGAPATKPATAPKKKPAKRGATTHAATPPTSAPTAH